MMRLEKATWKGGPKLVLSPSGEHDLVIGLHIPQECCIVGLAERPYLLIVDTGGGVSQTLKKLPYLTHQHTRLM